MFLNKLKLGERAQVISILDDKTIDKQRLFDLGITAGTEIESLYTSPSDNPTAYLIRGSVFALRDETAGKIIVKITD